MRPESEKDIPRGADRLPQRSARTAGNATTRVLSATLYDMSLTIPGVARLAPSVHDLLSRGLQPFGTGNSTGIDLIVSGETLTVFFDCVIDPRYQAVQVAQEIRYGTEPVIEHSGLKLGNVNVRIVGFETCT